VPVDIESIRADLLPPLVMSVPRWLPRYPKDRTISCEPDSDRADPFHAASRDGVLPDQVMWAVRAAIEGAGMAVTGIARFERFFRVVASLDVDKSDLRRFDEFVNQKIYDLLLRGVANAKANGRDVIQPQDLPITKGLQESIHAFKRVDQDTEVGPILEDLVARPPLDATLSEETEQKLPSIAGGLAVAIAETLKIVDPGIRNPQSKHWDTAYRIFNLLL
jgi:hypothetical protein